MSQATLNQIARKADGYGSQHAMIGQFLDSVGDGSGVVQATADLSGGEIFFIQPPAGKIFFIQPPAGKIFHIARMLVHIEDSGPTSADDYGGISALTNGIVVRCQNDTGTILNLTGGLPIQTNGAWGRVCFDLKLDGFGAGNDFVNARWTFEKSGVFLELVGDNNDRLEVVFSDSFVGLASHTFMVQGHIIG